MFSSIILVASEQAQNVLRVELLGILAREIQKSNISAKELKACLKG